MKFCPKCGAQLEDDVKFCPVCGTKYEMVLSAIPGAAVSPDPIAAEIAAEDAVPNEEPEPIPVSPIFEQTPPRAPQPPKQQYVPPVAPPQYTQQQGGTQYQPTQRPLNVQNPNDPISTWGYVGIFFLIGIPLVGFLLTIVWACGGCYKLAKQKLARAVLIIMLIGLVCTVVLCILGALIFGDTIRDLIWEIEHGYSNWPYDFAGYSRFGELLAAFC